jgi:hypothetical protein
MVPTMVGLAFCFGAVDQYLGSLWSVTHLGSWTLDLTTMSAPWVGLPFLVGARRSDARGAAVGGAMATFAALFGYFVMTLSPVEGVTAARIHLAAFLASQAHVLLPAVVTGPAWGWLGFRWRATRSRLSAALVAGTFCLEPVARVAYGRPFRAPATAAAEVCAGLLLVAAMALAVHRHGTQRSGDAGGLQ